jgi:lantibiotic transport system permease protein
MKLLKIELMKMKKNFIYPLIVIMPTLALGLAYLLLQKLARLNPDKSMDMIFTDIMIAGSGQIYLGFLLPAFIIYVCLVSNNVEKANSGLRGCMLLPVKKSKLYFSKLTAQFLVVAANVLLYFIEFIGLMLKTGTSNLGVAEILFRLPITLLAILPILVIFSEITRRISSIMVSLGMTTMLMLSVNLIIQSKYAYLAPWTYGIQVFLGAIEKDKLLIMLALGIVCSVIPMILGKRAFSNQSV